VDPGFRVDLRPSAQRALPALLLRWRGVSRALPCSRPRRRGRPSHDRAAEQFEPNAAAEAPGPGHRLQLTLRVGGGADGGAAAVRSAAFDPGGHLEKSQLRKRALEKFKQFLLACYGIRNRQRHACIDVRASWCGTNRGGQGWMHSSVNIAGRSLSHSGLTTQGRGIA
jgi:hypothetical protein